MSKGQLTPTTFEGVVDFANQIAKSQMVPQSFRGKPEDIIVAVQWGNEVGLGPMAALQGISVINGKPSLGGEAMLALVSSHPAFGGCEERIEEKNGEYTAVCTVKRVILGKEVEKTFTFSQADAVRAGLWNKKGSPWGSYPKRMLQMRARGFALRDSFPDALKGVISSEEAGDMPTDEMRVVNPLDTFFAGGQEELPPTIEHTEPSEGEDDPIQLIEIDAYEKPSEAPEQWFFKLPPFKQGQEEEIYHYDTAEDWCVEFSSQMNSMGDDDEFTPEERRHNIKEMKTCNDEIIERIKSERSELVAGIQNGYLKKLRQLSAKAKEANNG